MNRKQRKGIEAEIVALNGTALDLEIRAEAAALDFESTGDPRYSDIYHALTDEAEALLEHSDLLNGVLKGTVPADSVVTDRIFSA